MKGIILAGGLGTRLRPLTLVTNKHLLPVYDRPMIYYPIQCLLNAGIRDILIVTGGEHAGDFLKLLKNGKHLGVKHLEYAYQEGEGGMARVASAFSNATRPSTSAFSQAFRNRSSNDCVRSSYGWISTL